MLKWIGNMLLITIALLAVTVTMPLACCWLVRSDIGVQLVFWMGPFACAVWVLVLSQIVSSRCWRGAEEVRRWRASRGGYIATVPAAFLWMTFGLFGSFAAEFAVMFFVRKVWLLPIATFLPVPLAVLWCSRRG